MPKEQDLLIQEIKDVTIATFYAPRILDRDHVDRIGAELCLWVGQRNGRKLVLDFTNVKLLSSAVLGVLMDLRGKSERIKGQIVLCGLRPALYKVFEVSKLERGAANLCHLPCGATPCAVHASLRQT